MLNNVGEKAPTLWNTKPLGALLVILRSRLLLYSTGSGVNRVQVVLSEFSVRFFLKGRFIS